MKRIILTTSFIIMSLSLSVSALANNYQFESGPDTKQIFGVPTQTDAVPRNPELENVRRNKDAAFNPPPFGVFSGNIPTDPSSPYHDNIRSGSALNVTNPTASGGTLTATGPVMSDTGTLVSTSILGSDALNTLPLYYSDGSIGILRIPKLNLTVKVYEGETLENMRKGAGHFEFTSVWDGNIGIAAHNRGSAGYFAGVKDLNDGDIITFETQYGTRQYAVFSKEKISDTDYSKLVWTSENIITLITCVENSPSQRWAIQGYEIR